MDKLQKLLRLEELYEEYPLITPEEYEEMEKLTKELREYGCTTAHRVVKGLK